MKTFKPRDLKIVLEDILKIIPETESELINNLNYVLKGLAYCPPETMGDRWRQVHSIFWNHHVPELRFDWQRQLINIWTNNESLTTNNID